MNQPDLVGNPEELTNEWFTQVLHANNYDASVKGFTVNRVGTGQVARCYRFELDVEGDKNAPRSMIGKFPSTDPATADNAVNLGLYIAELGFYRDLAEQLPISTARCYYANIDRDNRDFVLLLADLSPAAQGDQMEGCSLAVAERAIDELAAMHAATWNGKSLDGCSWLAKMAGQHEEFFVGQKQCTAEFMQRLGNRLEPEIVELIERTNTGYDNLVTLLTEQPSALVHLDYRADNLMIDETCEPPTVTAVDWQTLSLGPPSIDIAYFIGASLKAEVRRAHETVLLKRYYDLILKNGVSEFSWEQCQSDYQAGCYWGMMMAIVSATVVEETERGNEMFTTMARRHGNQILDIGADELLSH